MVAFPPWTVARGDEATAGSPPNSAGIELFEKRIRPLMAKHCCECHGPETQENDLRLDRYADMIRGGASGPAIVPGKVDGSLLITAVRYVDSELQMPPEGKLTDAEVADLVRWVEAGAPHPEAAAVAVHAPAALDDSVDDSPHWAFQPLAESAPPDVRDRGWPRTPIDRFILARLEAASLAPAPPADRRTLFRRAAFDLTGLPPAPDAMTAFLADESPAAFARAVDRLLASPRYGEKWGRHWLDVARYADSNGSDENIAHGNAWRYRNYVIDAINRDEPYDEFVRAQLAGDLLVGGDPQVRNERLIATGFLSLGPKVLAEVDETKMEMDIIDEQIDTLGKALLGLTLGCARCHDHKFDPVSMRDYYALAGVFKSTLTMDSLTKIARWHENPLADAAYDLAKSAHEARVAAQRARVDARLAAAKEIHMCQREAGASPVPTGAEDVEAAFPQETRDELKRLRDELAELEKQTPEPPSAMGVMERTPTDVAIHIRGSHLTLGDVVARGLPRLLAAGASEVDLQQSGRLTLANQLTRPDNPLFARVIVNRIWRWRFGRGLVESTDNFGLQGQAPSHPDLLDAMAVDLIREGWSLKRLHRQLAVSAAYEMGSQNDAAAAVVDPRNTLLWQARMRRLEAEEIRDALLSVSGQLDESQGEAPLTVANRTHIFDHTSRDQTNYATQRRSVYLPVVRNHLHDSFTLFDYADAGSPLGDRATSTVASQSLYLLNSDFVVDMARRLADRALADAAADDRQRIVRLYEWTFARPPTDDEIVRLREFVDRFDKQLATDGLDDDEARRREAWRLACQALIMSSEFVYVR